MDDQNKNLILATVLSLIVIVVWLTVFPPPQPDAIAGTGHRQWPEHAPAGECCCHIPTASGDAQSGGATTAAPVDAIETAKSTAPRVDY